MIDDKTKLEELRKLVAYHNHLYFVDDNPELADTEYDDLYRELLQLESQHPEWDDPNSPTKMVGGKVSHKLSSIKHHYPVTSLDKAYASDVVTDFYMTSKSRVKHYSREEFGLGYIVEPKYDGLTLILQYRDGVLLRAVTRGDGFYGEDVTHNAKIIKNIPKTLAYEVQNVYVRGEAIISKADFDQINYLRRVEGKEEFKSARNLVSGSIRQLDSEVTKTRNIKFYPYEVLAVYDGKADGKCIYLYGDGHHRSYILKTHEQTMNFLVKCGFEDNPDQRHKFNTLDELYKFCCNDDFYNRLKALPYDIDGFVIKVNSMKLRHELGTHPTYPYWQLAFKLPQTNFKTKLLRVEWGIGKTGAITPVGILKTVRIDGTDVSRATLHSLNEIKRLNLQLNAWVWIEKAGGIIPAITAMACEQDSDAELESIKPPDACPACGATVSVSANGLVTCDNADACMGTFHKRLLYFVGKKGLDIDGFGDKLCNALLDQGLVDRFSDVFQLDLDDLKQIVGKKVAEKIIIGIELCRSISLSKFISILQIPNIGQTSSKQLADHFKTLLNLMKAKPSDLSALDNFGEVMVNSVYNYFQNVENLEEIERLQEHLSFKEFETSNKLDGVFCITGTLTKPRKFFEDLIQANGGSISGSVSKKVNFLLAGSDAGGKLDKAKELGIIILSEEDFLEKVK